MSASKAILAKPPQRRLRKEARRRQLLETARLVVREEGVDRLTLGHLADRASISKPVVYDHFETRSELLIELYRHIDVERVDTFRDAMARDKRSLDETVRVLATTYIDCAAETDGEFQAVGAALTGSGDKAAVFQELLDNCVRMFVSVLGPHTSASHAEFERCCVGLVGAGEALSALLVRRRCSRVEAIETFAQLIEVVLGPHANSRLPEKTSSVARNDDLSWGG
ncbi:MULTISPECIES: TetR/AcrR family transcriptional regulator [unclassified Rhizobium]|uniref:TetR/AcrR family transcriptional regulator n=1 Tax=unclassified Rhizobium TaxID=2613769 RepID=UPI000A837718|nr:MULTISPECIES: TetR/AcrR family transcriptional regulator [unclassified Rhizobium]